MNSNIVLYIGILFHATYIWSIFDIYFCSPLVHGMTPFAVTSTQAPASRLVLIVGDGLRADKFFESALPVDQDGFDDQGSDTSAHDASPPVGRAPFLRDVVLNRGTWGISHTRMPTESRPGHVAIIAGFYEDVSAVTKGWKMNPVNFDSLFNQSRHTWSFGSPDILPMFSEGATDPSRVETFTYSAEDEDWTKADASTLDTWVFDRFESLFAKAEHDPILRDRLRQDKIVFFLHLLGLDSNGHAHRPHSKEYLRNIRSVDAGIRRVSEMMDKFYDNDGKTAFVFTADHGMGNRGSHGDGHPDNTRTPLVAWGAGVAGPGKGGDEHDATSRGWGLGDLARRDVNQADIAPLMATLLGLPFPMNSVGVLPIDFLNMPSQFKAESALVNARQIYAQYDVKQRLKGERELIFRPFISKSNLTHQPEIMLAEAERLVSIGEDVKAEELCLQIINLCLEGLRYFQTYDWLFLRSVVSAGYLGWIAYSLSFLTKAYVVDAMATKISIGENNGRNKSINGNGHRNAVVIRVLAGSIFLCLAAMFQYQRAPVMYYLYAFFPAFFWAETATYSRYLRTALRSGTTGNTGWIKIVLGGIAYVLGLEMLVYSYFNRGILSVCFVVMSVWPLFSGTKLLFQGKLLPALWTVACLATGMFTLLPIEKGEDISLISIGGYIIIATGILAYCVSPKFLLPESSQSLTKVRGALAAQTGLSILATFVVRSSVASLQKKQGLPVLNQTVSWLILGISFLTPFVYGARSGQHYLHRLLVIYLAYAPVFILLSISYEVLFYVSFSITLLLWIEIERQLYALEEQRPLAEDVADLARNNKTNADNRSTHTRELRGRDVRTAVFFLFFLNVAFFGTGNVASISSFSLEAVLRLIPVFDPFAMGALLIFKILIPFLLLSAAFGTLARSLDLPPFALFFLVLSTTDVMTLNFFYLVQDHGSWLDIGTSISHFVIASSFVLLNILLFGLAQLLVGRTIVPRDVRREGRKNR